MSLDAFIETTGGPPQQAPGSIVVDFSQIALSTIMATYQPADINQAEDKSLLVKHAILASLKQNIRRFANQGYDEIVVAVDNGDGGYWRRDVAESYKRNRKKGREESPWDFPVIYSIMDSLVQELREFFPWKIIRVKRVEADDVIGTLTKYWAANDRRVLIISSDGDFTQLHDMGDVKQWSPMQKKLVTKKTGSSHGDLVMKMAKGDAKDNVGPYRCPVHHYEIPGSKAPPVSQKLITALIDDPDTAVEEQFRERWEQNRKLLDLTMVPEEFTAQIFDQYHSAKPARGRVYSYLARSKMTKLLNDIAAFEVRP